MNQMEDLPSSEIAKVLGCRESTVRNHLFNARKLMQQQLKKRFPEYSRLWEPKEQQ
jgi:DNA-directed RNA polymerase specialized sigma24 family protein